MTRKVAIGAVALSVVVTAISLSGCGGSSSKDYAALSGAYVVARGRVPDGAVFSIIGQRIRLCGQAELLLMVHFDNPGQVVGGGGDDRGRLIGEHGHECEEPLPYMGGGNVLDNVLESNSTEGCESGPFTIFYGVLTEPGDKVRIRSDGRVFVTHKTSLPARLETAGELVYGVTDGAGMKVEIAEPGKAYEERGGSSSRPGPCEWARQAPVRAEHTHLVRDVAATEVCLHRRGFPPVPPREATKFLVAQLECFREAARASKKPRVSYPWPDSSL